MKDKRNRTQELKLLSAYLDGGLNPSRREKLETQLQRDPALRERYNDLRRIKFTLSSLTHLKAPRNFTLTPEMVTVRRRKSAPVFTALKLASSVAGILLVALVSIELLWGGIGSPRQMDMPASVAESEMLDEDKAEPLIIWDDSGANEAVGTGGGDDRAFSTDPEYAEQVEEETEAAPEEEESQTTLEEEAVQPEEETSKSAEENPILGLNLEEAGEVIDRGEASIQEEGTVFTGLSPLRWIEIALAVTFLGGLITFWVLQKRQ
jgi:hypothetical protein